MSLCYILTQLLFFMIFKFLLWLKIKPVGLWLWFWVIQNDLTVLASLSKQNRKFYIHEIQWKWKRKRKRKL